MKLNIGKLLPLFALPSFVTAVDECAVEEGKCLKAHVRGDPHITTFSGVKYDCQGKGEFVLAKSLDKGDPFQVNAFMVDPLNQPGKQVSVTRAVAFKVDPDIPMLRVKTQDGFQGGCTLEYEVVPDDGSPPYSITGNYLKEKFPLEFRHKIKNGQVKNQEIKITSEDTDTKMRFVYKDHDLKISVTVKESKKLRYGCVMGIAVCVQEKNHPNLTGLLGTPNSNTNDDWMDENGAPIAMPTSNTQLKLRGTDYCHDNHCVDDFVDSMFGATTWVNQCDDNNYDKAATQKILEDAEKACAKAGITGYDYDALYDAAMSCKSSQNNDCSSTCPVGLDEAEDENNNASECNDESGPPPPTSAPTKSPTLAPTERPTPPPTKNPTLAPTERPTPPPTKSPTLAPTQRPTPRPTPQPTPPPTKNPTLAPTERPTPRPTPPPTKSPTLAPTESPTPRPTPPPTKSPTLAPTQRPTPPPTKNPTLAPTKSPSDSPSTSQPSSAPSHRPSAMNSSSPTVTSEPTLAPSNKPSASPSTSQPSSAPSHRPSAMDSTSPTDTSEPTLAPSNRPSASPSTSQPSSAPSNRSNRPSAVDSTSPTVSPAPTSVPSTTPSASPSDSRPVASSNGDPHFKTWKNEHFEFHGQCDIILAKDTDFANGIGLDVQIRTKLVRFWSYIQTAAIRIGEDILEIKGSSDTNYHDTHYWFNFQYQADVTSIGGFPLTIRNTGSHKRFFEIDLSSKFPGQKIVLSTFKEFISVDFKGGTAESFGNTVGMLGDFKSGKTLARDGATEINDFTEFGIEWQVRPSDDMLFHDMSEPQFPKQCILPEDPRGERRRRLDESVISVDQAEAACATLKDPLTIKDCVYDILATQDMDMVGAF